MRFGKKLKLPSTMQIKHQILTMWLADQRNKEAAEQGIGVPTLEEPDDLENAVIGASPKQTNVRTTS